VIRTSLDPISSCILKAGCCTVQGVAARAQSVRARASRAGGTCDALPRRMDFVALALGLGFFAASWVSSRSASDFETEGGVMSAFTLLAGGIAVALLVYLVVALLAPEKL
jgi:K+-transporting ATPase KdpF subunit